VQNIRKVGGGAAPGGINVATTNAIVLSGLTGGWTDLHGTYTKSGDPTNVYNGGVDGLATGAVYFNSDYSGGNRDGAAIWYGSFFGDLGWHITFYDDNSYRLGFVASANNATVPVSGYSNIAGYTGTITLTAAPSGIPVASTASVVIGNAGAGNNGTYVKKVPQQLLLTTGPVSLYSNIAGACYVLGAENADGRILLSPDAQAWDDLEAGNPQFGTPLGSWKLGYVYYEGGDTSAWLFTEIATNASTNTSYIPDTGWSPSITITAA